MSQFPQAPKADEPQGVEITHELMADLRKRNAEYRAAGANFVAFPRASVLTLLDALDDMANIVDDLLTQLEALEAPQC